MLPPPPRATHTHGAAPSASHKLHVRRCLCRCLHGRPAGESTEPGEKGPEGAQDPADRTHHLAHPHTVCQRRRGGGEPP
eukprot:1820195-Rhodomonas_salina.1